MIEKIKNILKKIFGRKTEIRIIADGQSETDIENYQDITTENFTAIFANTLTTLAFGDSSVSVVSDGEPTERTALLDDITQQIWHNVKQNIALGNGCGMIASIPYVSGNKIYIDTVAKNRFFITAAQGDDITECVVLADKIIKNGKTYERFTEYKIENGNYIITQKAVLDEREIPITNVPEWADITPVIVFENVDRLPIGVYRCPASNRQPNSINGVPITYGCDETIRKIIKTLADIEIEFERKKVMVFADNGLFDKDKKLSDLYVKTNPIGKMGSDSGISTYDPAFRESAYFTKLDRLYAQLEKEVGTSRGILTDLSVTGATATEIKRAMLQTFNICNDIQKNAERYFDDLIYGCNVLANAFRLSPPSEYNVKFDWSYSMLEDSAATFNQLIQAKTAGAVSAAEIRNFVKSSESMADSQSAVDEIAKNEPTLSMLVGE